MASFCVSIFCVLNFLFVVRAQNFPPEFLFDEPTINGEVSYFSLVNQIQQWHQLNPNACGQDTSTCSVKKLVNDFESCAGASIPGTNPRKNLRIINGCPLSTHATAGWSVAVILNTTLCGGTLVSPQHVIVAAHCLNLGVGSNTHPSFRSIGVIVGATDLHYREPGARLFALESFAKHPSFDADVFASDTAILKLARPVQFNGKDGVRPACLADRPSTILNKDCLLVGYGVTSASTGFLTSEDLGAGNLRYSILAVQELRTCLTLAEQSGDGPPGSLTKGPSPQWLFCAAGKRMKHNSDSCRGDSGSGVVCKSPTTGRWTLQGVVSFGPNQCAQIPSFYADAYNLGIRNPVKVNAISTLSSAATYVENDPCSATKFKPASAFGGFPASTLLSSRPQRLPFFGRPTFFGQDAPPKIVDLLADVDEAAMQRPVKNLTSSASTTIDLLGSVITH